MRTKIIEIIRESRPDIEEIETANFITDGIFDSFDVVTLVATLDKAFGISIDGVKISPQYFDTIDDIVRLVKESQGQCY